MKEEIIPNAKNIQALALVERSR